jgi:hypothetical protein
MDTHRVTLLLMLVILAGMGTLTYLLLSSYRNEVLSASTSVRITAPTPTPTPVILRPGWSVFSNPQYAYSIQYPPTVKPIVNPPSDIYLYFVTFTTIPKDDEIVTLPEDIYSLSIRKDSLENEVAFQRSRIEGHNPVAFQEQKQFSYKGQPAIQLNYAPASTSAKPLTLVSISKSPVVFTIYFPNLTDSSVVDQVLETLTFSP